MRYTVNIVYRIKRTGVPTFIKKQKFQSLQKFRSQVKHSLNSLTEARKMFSHWKVIMLSHSKMVYDNGMDQ